MEDTKWIVRWKYEIATKPIRPGVWRRKEGGYLVRGRALDCRTGKQKEVCKIVNGGDAIAAYRFLQAQLDRIKNGPKQEAKQRVRFNEYAASVMERKVAMGELNSAKTREKWEMILRVHLYEEFGDFYVDAISRTDILEWLKKLGLKVQARLYSPLTVNSWLSVLRVILNSAAVEFEWEKNPMMGINDLDTSTHFTYTEEEPNALTLTEVRQFLSLMLEMFPQHFAMVAIGFATGLRPSSLRPLRRQGASSDVLWDQRRIHVRRSHTMGDEVMNTTKQKTRYDLTLPANLMDILAWHVRELPAGPMKDSDLLFPSTIGGFRSKAVLDKPFAGVTEEMGLTKRITPRAMRRTFQDLARSADIERVVRQKICGHAGDDMTDLYSTISQPEIEQAVGKITAVAGYEDLLRHVAPWWESGGKSAETENGQSALPS